MALGYNNKQKSVHNVEQNELTQYAIDDEYKTMYFNDACYGTQGRRLVAISATHDGNYLTSIQNKYLKVELNCSLSHIQVLEEEMNLKEDGLEVIGFTSGSTCSYLQQQINLFRV